MKQVVIGIIPTSNYMVTDDTFKDTYRYGNNYIKKIVENNAIPYLIPLNNEKIIPNTLENCDGLILTGGFRIRPVDFEIIDYFYKHNKPILGICMGMQTLAMYSVNQKEPKKILKEINSTINHWPYELTRENNDLKVHKDYINKQSIMYEIFKKEEIEVNSLHNQTITEVGDLFNVTIKSEDNLIEGIESNNDHFVLGVQFHPEILPEYNEIFKVFIEKCKK